MITNYAKQKALKAMFNLADEADFGTNTYLGLSLTEPTVDGGNVTEPAAENGYVRKLISLYATNYSSSTADLVNLIKYDTDQQLIRNHQEIHFNEATAAWGECAYLCVFDAASAGNLLSYNQILNEEGEPSPISPAPNSVAVLRQDQLTIDME